MTTSMKQAQVKLRKMQKKTEGSLMHVLFPNRKRR